MLHQKSYKFLLFAILSLGIASESRLTACEPVSLSYIATGAAVGAVHGLVNNYVASKCATKIDENPSSTNYGKKCKPVPAFYILSYVLATAFESSVLAPIQIDATSSYLSKLFLVNCSHGVAQSLVESYDPETRSFATPALNFTLLQSFFNGIGLKYALIKQQESILAA